MSALAPKVAVVGSLNLDYIASVELLPRPGQTVPATNLVRRFGGKGANQAVAAARQGASVSMLGCVGDDAGGEAYLNRLREEGIDTAGVGSTGKALTGTALIAVDSAAENIIVVAAGANAHFKPASLRDHRQRITSARLVLLQLEIPMPTVLEAVRIANRAKVPVLLNPSPLRDGFPWGTLKLDTLLVNHGEAESIFGLSPASLPARLDRWRTALRQRGVECLLVTCGARPTICLTAHDFLRIPTLKVKPVDTVGAGDAFAGTFAARRAEGVGLREAIRLANCAGALATLKSGAQEAIPSRAATNKALRQLSV